MKNVAKICFLILHAFLVRDLTAQSVIIDSLTNRITQTDGEEQIKTLILLAEANREYDFQECILKGKRAVKLAKETKKTNLQALGKKSIGVSYLYEGNLEQALQYFEESLDLFSKIDNQQGVANCLNNIGLVYLEFGKFKKAKEYYEKKISIVEVFGNKKSMASALIQLGNINYYMSDFQRALDNYYEAKYLYEEIDDIPGQADAYYSMGVIYSEIKSLPKALKYYRVADSIYRLTQNKRDLSHVLNNIARIYSFDFKDFEKAKELYIESLELKKQLNDNVGIAMAYNNLGTVYGSIGEYKTAQIYFAKSMDLYSQIGSESGLIMVNYNIGELFREHNDLQDAILSYKESLKMAEKNGEVSYINKNYESLLLTYALDCNYEKFLNYYNLFSIGKDTLIDRLYQSEVDAIEAKYKVNELLQERIELQMNDELKRAEIKKYRLYFGGIVVLFLLLIVLNLSYLRKK